MPSLTHSVAPPLHSPRDLEAVDAAARALVDAATRARESLVLAVSGGCDSMVMLHAVARAWSACTGASSSSTAPRVATFDHGTGTQATEAADLVAREAARLGLPVRAGRGRLLEATEAQWRAARWRFIRADAPPDARFVTAHTRDDHLETVVIRALRDAGARGLAGLAAPSRDVARPFLDLRREAIRAYAILRSVPFVEDPSNASRAHLRNRVRHDLLPALARVRPQLGDEMLSIADRAAVLRNEIDAIARTFVIAESSGTIRVAREELATYDSPALCVLWPAIAARALVTLDRRGTLRLAQFTTSGAPGARIQLSGGVEVYRHRDAFVVRRTAPAPPVDDVLPLVGMVQLGEWRFRPQSAALDRASWSSTETPGEGRPVRPNDAWSADLPADRRLTVRSWRAADRMRAREDEAARRVKRFFGDAQIPGPGRAGWPVVLADDEIVWIPGVRRTAAASERSGRPVVRYTCERFDGGLPSN
jgi:tRNA(Ile)-lysidine synthase